MAYFSATPSSAKVRTTENYVSTVDYLSQIHKDSVRDDFTKRYGDQGITGLMEALGRKEPVDQRSFKHFEEDWIHQTFTIETDDDTKAITGGYQIEVDLSSYDNADYAPFGLNDIIEFENGQVGLIVAISVDGADWETVSGYSTSSPAT